jgi:hypothetical protein
MMCAAYSGNFNSEFSCLMSFRRLSACLSNASSIWTDPTSRATVDGVVSDVIRQQSYRRLRGKPVGSSSRSRSIISPSVLFTLSAQMS